MPWRDYPAEVLRYTRGRGRLSWEPDGYAPCRRPEEVIAAYGYDCNADTANTADSVFCSRGAGHTVRWDEVPGMAHIQTNVLKADEEPEEPAVTRQRSEAYRGSLLQDKKLMRIFEMTYGPIKRRSGEALHTPKPTGNSPKPGKAAPLPEGPEYLLVDGYNIIFAWEELAELAKTDLDAARHRLIQILCNYQGYRQCELILVFDAYKVKGNPGSIERHHGISVVYTKEAETADMYIEKVTHTLAKEHRVRVATSDGLEQIIILGHGAIRVPARAVPGGSGAGGTGHPGDTGEPVACPFRAPAVGRQRRSRLSARRAKGRRLRGRGGLRPAAAPAAPHPAGAYTVPVMTSLVTPGVMRHRPVSASCTAVAAGTVMVPAVVAKAPSRYRRCSRCQG